MLSGSCDARLRPESASLSSLVLAAVLVAALLHATWNLIVKASPNTGFDLAMVAGAAAAIGGVMLPGIGLPGPGSWPRAATSAVIPLAQYALMAAAYRFGDLSHVYPIMRGTPPLLLALAAGPILGESLGPAGWAGVLLISGGIIAMAVSAGGLTASRGTAFALANAVVIACYSLVEGHGARLSGNPPAYTMLVCVLDAVPVVLPVLIARRMEFLAHVAARWRLGLVGGAATLGSYGIVLWAMTQAPIALVAALRETSIVFATVLSALILKERFPWTRHAAAGLIMAGAVAFRLA